MQWVVEGAPAKNRAIYSFDSKVGVGPHGFEFQRTACCSHTTRAHLGCSYVQKEIIITNHVTVIFILILLNQTTELSLPTLLTLLHQLALPPRSCPSDICSLVSAPALQLLATNKRHYAINIPQCGAQPHNRCSPVRLYMLRIDYCSFLKKLQHFAHSKTAYLQVRRSRRNL